jgi:proteasome lid subunit RPN8/RPN11
MDNQTESVAKRYLRRQYNNEECWILKGQRGRWFWSAKYDRYSLGKPTTVVFDSDYVYAHQNEIIGWVHTHPHWTAHPSDTDDATMKAWVCALGHPLLCCIDGTDGLRAHWYLDDESDAIEVPAYRFRRGIYGVLPKQLRTDNGPEVRS